MGTIEVSRALKSLQYLTTDCGSGAELLTG